MYFFTYPLHLLPLPPSTHAWLKGLPGTSWKLPLFKNSWLAAAFSRCPGRTPTGTRRRRTRWRTGCATRSSPPPSTSSSRSSSWSSSTRSSTAGSGGGTCERWSCDRERSKHPQPKYAGLYGRPCIYGCRYGSCKFNFVQLKELLLLKSKTQIGGGGRALLLYDFTERQVCRIY